MNIYSIPSLIASITVPLLAIFVFSRNKTSPVNRAFARWLSAITIWHLGVFCMFCAPNEKYAMLFSKFLHFGVIFIPVTYFHFILTIVGFTRLRRTLLFVCYFLSSVFAFTNLSDLVITNIVRLTYSYYGVAGPLYLPFVFYFGMIVVYCHFLLFKTRKEGSPVHRLQIKYLLIASFVAYAGVVDFLPSFGIDIYNFGNLLNVIFVSIVSYAIVRHHLMDIEVIIKKTIMFTSLFALVLASAVIVTVIIEGLVGQLFTIHHTASMLLSAVVAMILYEPTRKFIVDITDRYLFQKRFDYRKLIKDAGMGLARINSLNYQLKLIAHFLTMRGRIKTVAIYMPDGVGRDFILKEYRSSSGKYEALSFVSADSSILNYMRKERKRSYLRFFEVDEWAQIQLRTPEVFKYDFQDLRQEMLHLKADLIIASFYQNDLNGLVVLGEKKSEELYNDEDINVFAAIAHESAIAIENARLFDEKIERTVELEELNRELELSNVRLRETQASLIVAEKNATMVGMAKAIGHEVYNPLCTVEGRAELLERKMKQLLPRVLELSKNSNGGEEAQKDKETFDQMIDFVHRIENSARRIKVAVQTLTNILKESKGEMTSLNFLVLWKEAVEATRFSTYDENLSYCEFKESIKANLVIHGNLEQLIQVFTNLIKNAYEAMAKMKHRQILVKADIDFENPKMARIEVSDNGPGMSKEIQRKIFQQGFSTKVSKDKGIGTAGQGQGLYVCRHIIESVHKGEIVVESEEGKGAVFIIRLPLAEAEEVPLEESA